MHRRLTVLNVPLPFTAIPENAPQCDIGPKGVDVDIDPAAWAKNAKHLANYLLRLIGVMENAVRINIIKACILKRKMPRVGFIDGCEIADASARQLNMFGRQVDPGCQRPMLGELQQIASGSASDFENFVSLVLTELSGFVEPGIDGVALLLS